MPQYFISKYFLTLASKALFSRCFNCSQVTAIKLHKVCRFENFKCSLKLLKWTKAIINFKAESCTFSHYWLHQLLRVMRDQCRCSKLKFPSPVLGTASIAMLSRHQCSKVKITQPRCHGTRHSVSKIGSHVVGGKISCGGEWLMLRSVFSRVDGW